MTTPEVQAWAEAIADLPVTPAEVAAGQRIAALLARPTSDAAAAWVAEALAAAPEPTEAQLAKVAALLWADHH